jgi:hypothetical protein
MHTEWSVSRLIDAPPDKVLASLVIPAARDVMSLDNDRGRRVYKALTCIDKRRRVAN